jgi:hypothetical protein
MQQSKLNNKTTFITMKKLSLLLAAIMSFLSSYDAFAGDPLKNKGSNQYSTTILGLPPVPSGNYWQIGGNTASGTDWLGTQNAQPLIFKTNSTQQMAILANGNVQVTSLNNGNTGLVTYSTNGTLQPLNFNGNALYVLTGNGMFTSFASLDPWQINAAGLYYMGGSVGIGTSTPNAMLQVAGNEVVNGTVTAGNLTTTNVSASGTITSPTGNVGFGNNNITTTGSIHAGSFNVNNLTASTVTTSHIRPLPGDSIIHIGDSSFSLAVGGQAAGDLYFTPQVVGALGNNTMFNASTNSFAVGNNISFTGTSVNNSIAIGYGLTNSLSGITLGYTLPSLFVSGANNMVGINTTSPNASLNIEGSRHQTALAFEISYIFTPSNNTNISASDPPSFTIDTIGNTYAAGHVGIGTPNPDATLEVASVAGKAFSIGGPVAECATCEPPSYVFSDVFTVDNIGNTYAAGKVGIGTTTPTTALEVHGSGISVYSSNANNSLFFGQDQTGTLGEWAMQYVTANNLGPNTLGGLNFWKPFTSGNFGNNFLFLADNGNIGIGTANPKYLLDVNGSVRSNEVKVCLFGTCDFVFDDNYKLMSLDTLSAYLKYNHHLPGIASAKEMEAEGNVSLGKMDSQLLQKVEELTLYIVQQDKKMNDEHQQTQELQQQLKEMQAKLDTLTKNSK